jgi:hypothetical protein
MNAMDERSSLYCWCMSEEEKRFFNNIDTKLNGSYCKINLSSMFIPFFFIADAPNKYARVFLPTKTFQLILIFPDKERACPHRKAPPLR